ncbi:MAG: hypothetical protein GXP16_18995, partial [Gammaproteobacteria bacterium]|nr:hypothetical protein [Gammaproteobacteria bacterium]
MIRFVLISYLLTIGMVFIPVAPAMGDEVDDGGNSTFAVPRTHFGHPDLQGIWTNATLTTLERPDDFDALNLSPEEAEKLLSARQARWQEYEDAARDADGKLSAGADVGGYNTFWMDEGNSLAMVDGQYRSSIIVDPQDGSVPYSWSGRWNMLKHGLQYTRYDGPELRPLGERCVVGFGSTGGPPMLPVLYNNNYQIVQNSDHVLIFVEMNHDVRTIRLNSTHPPPHVKKWLGDSIGWWEGDTLVVETTNFHPDQGFRASTKHLLYASENLKVTEYFSRVDAQQIKYSFEMEDPQTYDQIWRGEMPLRKSSEAIYEYACHEGNYAMQGILAGARLLEEEGEGGGFLQMLAYW